MKKILFSVFVAVLVFGVSGVVNAEVNNAVTPSTNDINRANGWAHVNVTPSVGELELEFVSTRAFWSCFEYRVDNEPNTVVGVNPNPAITDGRWTQVCVNNSESIKTILADEFIEIRMVYGAESDERFDWTRFDVLFERTAEITSPSEGEVVSGLVSFDAVLNDKDGDDAVQWALRKGTCAAGVGTVFGNVDGYNNYFDWNGAIFHAEADVSSWEDGEYCFVFNPKESVGDAPIRLTRDFYVSNPPTEVSQCKKGGWENFSNPSFKNQGDCVSWLNSNENAKGNRKDN